MGNLQTISVFDDRGHRYDLELSFNDAALMDEHIVLDIVARMHPSDQPGADNSDLPRSVEASLSLSPLEGKGQVTIEGRSFEIDLAELSERMTEFVPRDEMAGAAQTLVGKIPEGFLDYLEDALELFEAIPSPDPFLGCLIKGGLSAGIGQAISCYRDARIIQVATPEEALDSIEWWEARYDSRPQTLVRLMMRCMRLNGLRMLGRAALRAAKCAIGM